MKKHKLLLLCFMLVGGLLIFASPGNAQLIDYCFEGNACYAFDNTNTIDFGEVDSYAGKVVYDSSIADSIGDPTAGFYHDSIQEFTVTLGSSLFSLDVSGFNRIAVWDRNWDSIFFAADLSGPSAIGVIRASLELTDQDGTAFASDALPTSINFSDFDSPVRLILGYSDSDFYVNGTSLTMFHPCEPSSSIPEPATMLLLGSGLLGLVGFSRKKLRKS
ncbi:MAG: PEP-CTERM sorting domain-containing protein [Thermodesulfobacteriota bacterium]